MKIQRQNLEEEYSTTADWLQEFADKLHKKSYDIENLKNIRQMTDSPKKFATIEEKMTDIKQRIGFGIIKDMSDNKSDNSKVASTHTCACNGPVKSSCKCEIKTASTEHKPEDIRSMEKIINYIKALIKDRHAVLTPVQVITECREQPNLYFHNLPIDIEKLKSFISSELDKYQDFDQDPKYIPRDDLSDGIDPNQESEFWSHAFPR